MTKNDKLLSIIWRLWRNNELNNKFMNDWFAVYQNLQEGYFDKIPEVVLDMIDLWIKDEDF